jgi:AcrR family transcriptional regulator
MTERDAEVTKQRLIAIAGEIFAEQGFSAATVREICTRAKANVAAVNYYFGDKMGLYIETVQAAHCAPPEMMNREWPAGVSPQDKLRFFIEQMLTHLLDDRRPAWHARLMMREMAEPTEACIKLVEAYIRPLADELRGILGEMLPEGTPEAERWLIGGSIMGQCLFHKVQKPVIELLMGPEQYGRLNVKILADHITQFSLAAIAARSPSSSPRSSSARGSAAGSAGGGKVLP